MRTASNEFGVDHFNLGILTVIGCHPPDDRLKSSYFGLESCSSLDSTRIDLYGANLSSSDERKRLMVVRALTSDQNTVLGEVPRCLDSLSHNSYTSYLITLLI